MNFSVDAFFEELKPYKDSVLLTPMSVKDISQLEMQVGQRFPAYYKNFLLNAGINQDVVFGFIDHVDDFEPLHDFLPEGDSNNYFRIGHNGGEDYWLLRSDDPEDHQVYYFDYSLSEKIKPLGKTFEELLAEAIDTIEADDQRKLNEEKSRVVEVSILTNDEVILFDVFTSVFRSHLQSDFELVGTTKAGVQREEMVFRIGSKEFVLKRNSFPDWPSPRYSLKFKESYKSKDEDTPRVILEKELSSKGIEFSRFDFGFN